MLELWNLDVGLSLHVVDQTVGSESRRGAISGMQ